VEMEASKLNPQNAKKSEAEGGTQWKEWTFCYIRRIWFNIEGDGHFRTAY